MGLPYGIPVLPVMTLQYDMNSRQLYAKKYAISTEDSVCHIPKAGKIIIARGGLETTFKPKAGVAAHALSWNIDSLPNIKAKARKDR